MHLKSIRRMYGFEERWRWKHHFLLVTWFVLLTAAPPKAHGYFLGDTKAVLHGCGDHWTLQDRAAMPLLFQMTVCMDIRVMGPGSWVAFSYSSVYAPRPELGLEGDDGALYVWLLRVRHRFPIQLSLKHWHRVCLRRDRQRNSFSLEVDGQTVAERTVVAQAIPASGSLWLGCHLRDRHSEAQLGQVELYMFRIWADLDDHPSCEDGTVIGWDSRYWGVTSPSAKQTDHNLPCVPSAETNSGPVLSTADSPLSSQMPATTGSPPLNCNISGLCSDTDAYFWMFLSVEARNSSEIRKDVTDLLTKAFGCRVNASQIFCQGGTNVQVVEVSCGEQRDVRNTTCGVLLKLSHAVSACDLQLAGAPALQQAGSERARARIIGEVERVGRNLCENLTSPGDNFVRCNFTSSLDDVCQSNTHSTFKCSPLQLNSSDAALQPTTHSCSRQRSRLCDCSTFCNSSSQFFATRININTPSVDISLLKRLSNTTVNNIPTARPVTSIPNNTTNYTVTTTDAITPSPSNTTNYTATTTDAVTTSPSNTTVYNITTDAVTVTQHNTTNNIATVRPVTTSPNNTTVNNIPTASPVITPGNTTVNNITTVRPVTPSPSNTTNYTATTTDAVTTSPSNTTQYNITTVEPVTSITNNTTNYTVTTTDTTTPSPSNTTDAVTTSPSNTTVNNIPTARPVTASPSNTTVNNITTARPVTAVPNSTTNYTVTTADTTTPPNNTTVNTTTDAITPSPGNTTVNNITTVRPVTPSPSNTTNYTTTVRPVTPSPSNTTNYTATTTDAVTTSPSNTTVNNIPTASPVTAIPNSTTNYNVTTTDTTTPSPSNTTVNNITTARPVTSSPNNTTHYNVTTADTTTPTPSNTAVYNITTVSPVTPSPSNTTVRNITSTYVFSKQHIKLHSRPVTAIPNSTTNYTVTTTDTTTPSPSNTTVYNITTVSPVTPSPSNTTTSPSNTTVNNITTVGPV
ncbi:mucin-2, partial [Hippoglossus stenolepis]|uniref:mucin-2 n=1 Tax=Hippoglossus stenolepis TaxID=195615 RepID=UPI001FAF6E45